MIAWTSLSSASGGTTLIEPRVCDVLPGHDGLLGLGAGQGSGRDLVSAADLPLDQPCPQPGLTGPADRLRGLIAGQQDQRAAAVGVVEGPLECRKVATEHVAEPVDHADPVPDQVGAMGYQQP